MFSLSLFHPTSVGHPHYIIQILFIPISADDHFDSHEI